MLTLQHLAHQCNGKTLLADLGVTLLPGALVRLEGENGSGKSLLLAKIAGQAGCARGSVLFAGEESRGDKEFFADLLYLGEDQTDLAPRQKVAKQLKIWTKKGQGDASLIPAAAHYFGLTPWKETPVKHLSTGWRQRLRLARLMLQPAAIWLLDRPFYALDEAGRRQLENLIVSRCKQNGIVIFTHNGETRLNPHGRLEV